MMEKLMKISMINDRPSVYLQEVLSIVIRTGVSVEIVRLKLVTGIASRLGPSCVTKRKTGHLGKLADELTTSIDFSGNKSTDRWHTEKSTDSKSSAKKKKSEAQTMQSPYFLCDQIQNCKPSKSIVLKPFFSLSG